jgi:hypothetical protein
MFIKQTPPLKNKTIKPSRCTCNKKNLKKGNVTTQHSSQNLSSKGTTERSSSQLQHIMEMERVKLNHKWRQKYIKGLYQSPDTTKT